MMKKKHNRRPAAWTAAALALILLAGCAGGTEPEPLQTPDPSYTEPGPAPADAPDSAPDSAPEPAPVDTPQPAPAPATESAPAGAPDSSSAAPEPAPADAAGPAPANESKPAPADAPDSAPAGPEDGNYTADAALSGGTGRASIQSPAQLRCADGQFFATIVWSSPNFDYMKVDGVRYELISAPGSNSSFEIPVAAFDQPLTVVADTVAMSEPHEVEYTITFDSASLTKQ